MSTLDRLVGRRGPSWLWRAWISAVFAVVAAAQTHAKQFTLRVGVMSPLEGTPSREAGTAHQNTIREVLPDSGRVRHVGDHVLELFPVYRNDGGTTASCQQVARELVEEQSVVAILGPVNTDCTKAVLAEGLNVPVISSLSTATFLTEDRDPWFFRVTMDDRARMKRYLEYLRRDDSLAWSESLVLFDPENGYAAGLAQDLESQLGSGVQKVPWGDVGTLTNGGPQASTPVFSLGGTRRAVEVVREIERVFGEVQPPRHLRLFLVGASSEFLEAAPIGTVTIGEPSLDPNELRLFPDLEKRVARFGTTRFVFPAYEAAKFVLLPAIDVAAENLLAGRRSPSDAIPELREGIREAIEQGSFDSLTPPRMIRFENGNLESPLTAPLYRVTPSLERLDSSAAQPWVKIEVDTEVHLFEKPIVIRLIGHSMGASDPVPLSIERVSASGVHSATVTLEGGRAEYAYHPWRPGNYRVRADVSYAPRNVKVRVDLGWGYLVATLFATVGSLLAGRNRPTWLLEGVLTGLLLTWLTSYARALPLSVLLPIPSLSEAQAINAALSGLLGGWMGPSILSKLIPARPPKPAGA